MKNNVERARNWTFIVYPGDSLPEDYVDILDSYHMAWAESPVHDKDCNPDGEIKKAHIHILVTFEGNKSFDQIQEISNSVNGTLVRKCNSVRGMIRYFIHIDNPEKYQYERSGIKTHGGLEIEQYFAATAAEKKRIIAEMIDWCEKVNCSEIRSLIKYAKLKHYEDWYDCLMVSGGLYAMNLYLTSRRNMIKEEAESNAKK